LKRLTLIHNFSNENNIGVLVFQKNQVQVDKAERVKSVADKLFVRMGKW